MFILVIIILYLLAYLGLPRINLEFGNQFLYHSSENIMAKHVHVVGMVSTKFSTNKYITTKTINRSLKYVIQKGIKIFRVDTDVNILYEFISRSFKYFISQISVVVFSEE